MSGIPHKESQHIVFIFFDATGCILTFLSFICVLTAKEIKTNFRPIFASCSLANFCVTAFFVTYDLIPSLYDGYVGHGYTRLAVVGSSIVFSLLHFLCFVFVEYISVRSMAREQSFENGKSLVLTIWILGISACSLFMAFAKLLLVFYTIAPLLIICGFVGFIFFYLRFVKKFRNNRVYVEEMRHKLEKETKHPLSHKIWKDNYVPRTLLVGYFICTLPWAFFLLIAAANNEVKSEYASTSNFLLIFSLNYHLYALICIYIWITERIKYLPKLL